jgi:general secretion pathway protein M
MNQSATLRKFVSQPLVAAALYLAVVSALAFVVASCVSDIMSQHADVAASAAMLEELEGRRPLAHSREPGTGAPFLEGTTVTVAGAVLLQRVSAAVTKLGGNVLSSQVELQGSQSKAGFLSIIASCEIDQPGLQRLLYDIEAGMPYLFIDQLVLQSPPNFAASGEGRLRVLLTVSGQWQNPK